MRVGLSLVALVVQGMSSACTGEGAGHIAPDSIAVNPGATPPDPANDPTPAPAPTTSANPTSATSPPAAVPGAAIVPMRSARAWTTALAPNARGGWNFITQTYEYGSGTPTEWIVLDLATGNQRVTEGPAAIYANSNYQIDGQLRAANGRIFFPELDDQMAYYDPATEAVEQVGKLPGTAADQLVFRVVFGPDGQLYGGTQSQGLPTVFRLDPDTLQYTVLGQVGRDRAAYSYAYYLAVDPPWLYAAVGESPWELAALNMTTGEQRILATRGDDGFMQLDTRPAGVSVTLIRGLHTAQQSSEIWWCADGQLLPFVPGQSPPFAARAVAPEDSPITAAPEVDASAVDPSGDGTGHLRWRADAQAPWRDASYRVAYTSPVGIDSLVALPDGTLLGGAAQYHGFFRYDPDAGAKAGSLLRTPSLGISGGPRTVVSGRAYLSGYPNGVLYAYDPARPWTASLVPSAADNPSYLGNFAAAGAHYAYFLEPSATGRLYYAGRRERDGVGGGVGYYDIAGSRFAGHHDGLASLDPAGLAVLDDLEVVVYAGKSLTADAAQLVVYDRELAERARQTVVPGMRDTGQLFRAAERGVIVGVSASDRVIYRHDVAAGAVRATQALPGAVIAATQRASDRSIWIVLGSALWRYDAATLAAVRVGDVPGAPTAGMLVWQGARLFWATGAELRPLATPGY